MSWKVLIVGRSLRKQIKDNFTLCKSHPRTFFRPMTSTEVIVWKLKWYQLTYLWSTPLVGNYGGWQRTELDLAYFPPISVAWHANAPCSLSPAFWRLRSKRLCVNSSILPCRVRGTTDDKSVRSLFNGIFICVKSTFGFISDVIDAVVSVKFICLVFFFWKMLNLLAIFFRIF